MNKLMEYVNWCKLLSSRLLCAEAITRLDGFSFFIFFRIENGAPNA